jgi:hypothetical protein
VVGVADQPVVPVLLVVLLAFVAFCAPMAVVVLSRGRVRSRRSSHLPSYSPRLEHPAPPAPPMQPVQPVVRAERPPLPRREHRPRGHEPEMAGTVLHAVHPAQDVAHVVTALTQAGFSVVVDPEHAGLLLVESPSDVRQHELVRRILTRRVA